MKVEAGTVTRIDRASRVVYAVFDDADVSEETPHTYLREPIPWAPAEFTPNNNGELVCLGPVGRPEVVVNDHFSCVGTPPAAGDTSWDLSGGTWVATPAAGLGVGTLRNTSGVGAEGFLRKTIQALTVSTDTMFHVTARIAVDAVTSPGIFALVGFYSDPSVVLGAAIIGDSARVWFIAGSQVEGLTIVPETFYDIDFMIVPEQIVGASFNGSQPAVDDADTAGALNDLTPALYVTDNVLNSTNQYRIRCDRYVLTALPTPLLPRGIEAP